MNTFIISSNIIVTVTIITIMVDLGVVENNSLLILEMDKRSGTAAQSSTELVRLVTVHNKLSKRIEINSL